MYKFLKECKKSINGVESNLEKRSITTYTNKDVNLPNLVSKIESWLKGLKHQVQVIEGDNKWLIQSKKNNVVRSLLGAARSFSVIVEGTSNAFTIQTTTGKWVNNITMAAIAGFFSGGSLLPIYGATGLWVVKIKNDLEEFIETTISFEKHE